MPELRFDIYNKKGMLFTNKEFVDYYGPQNGNCMEWEQATRPCSQEQARRLVLLQGSCPPYPEAGWDRFPAVTKNRF